MFKTIIIIISLFTLTFCTYNNANTSNVAELYSGAPNNDTNNIELSQICEEAGGILHIFNNGCANYCSVLESEQRPICTQAFKESCLCPENQCYDREHHQCRKYQ